MQAKRYYRYASIRDDILRKLRLETPPNVTVARLPAIPQLQSIIDQMCRQRGASCAASPGAPAGGAGEGGGGGAATARPGDDDDYDDDDDVRATTIKILLFPATRNQSQHFRIFVYLYSLSLLIQSSKKTYRSASCCSADSERPHRCCQLPNNLGSLCGDASLPKCTHGGSGPHVIHGFLHPPVHIPNGISIGLTF